MRITSKTYAPLCSRKRIEFILLAQCFKASWAIQHVQHRLIQEMYRQAKYTDTLKTEERSAQREAHGQNSVITVKEACIMTKRGANQKPKPGKHFARP
jgi:hypothetical protein